jgi:hypothetical protein
LCSYTDYTPLHEAAILEKPERTLAMEAMEWIKRGECSVVGAEALSKRLWKADRLSAREIRRDRIKKQYMEARNFEFKDHHFNKRKE